MVASCSLFLLKTEQEPLGINCGIRDLETLEREWLPVNSVRYCNVSLETDVAREGFKKEKNQQTNRFVCVWGSRRV